MEQQRTSISRKIRRPATYWSAILAMVLCLGALLAAPAAGAASQRRADFDHLRTGFPLTGMHAVTSCETCHVRGVFRGTPTQCSSCHSPGSGIASTSKSSNHIPTTAQCSECHRSTTVWTGSRFSHATAKTGTCATCHDDKKAKGKPTGHMPTSASCDTCHRTTAWTPATGGAKPNDAFHTFAGTSTCSTCHTGTGGMMGSTGVRFSHASVLTGTCTSCHIPTTINGVTAKGKGGSHVPTTDACDTCHTNFNSFSGASGGSAKPADTFHTFAGTSTCSTCHTSGGMMGSTGVKFSHSGIASGCFNCHKPTTINSVTARGKASDEFHTFAGTSSCETCHSTSGFMSFLTGARFNHASVLSGSCENCHRQTTHNGMTAKGKGGSHVPTTDACDTCHTNFNSFSGASGGSAKPADTFHTFAGTSTCSTCHTSGGMMGSTGVKFSHSGIASGCFNCHKPTTINSVTARGKPGDVFHTFAGTSTCETCHTNTSSFLSARFSHASVLTGTCASCHLPTTINGVTAKGKPGDTFHTFAGTNTCDTCHSPTGFSSFLTGVKFRHDNVTPGSCFNCHIPTTFNGMTAKGKSGSHVVTSAACDTCHKNFNSFLGASGGAKPNDTFHNFAGTSTCETCHTNPSSFSVVKFSHTGIASGCFNCHKPTTINSVTARGKPGDVFHTFAGTGTCETCHTNTASFLSARFSHASVLSGTCASCHIPTTINGVTAKGKSGSHMVTSAACDTCHKNFNSFTGAIYNHSGVVNNCFSCHNGSNAKGKPGDVFHTFAGTTTCESCHSPSSFTSFLNNVKFRHDSVTPGQCINCHRPTTINGITARGTASNHIPYMTQLLNGSSLTCDSCHKSFSSFGSAAMNHNGSQGNGAGWCKGCHMSGLNFQGDMEKKSLTHEKSTGVTDCSQSGCHKPLGNKGSAYTKWD